MYLSICLPTNGIIEWVFPALESIYSQNVDTSLFEVIVTDNGNNKEFEEKMISYMRNHTNLIYQKNEAYMFSNQLEALKLAHGDYLKFMNHRSIWIEGRLQYMIDFLTEYEEEKPVIYFSNGVRKWGPTYREFENFDSFVKNLGIHGTWTSGVGIWKEDYDKIPSNVEYDSISPHACILYSERNKKKYIINDRYWMKDITNDHSKKGSYDLYKAFALDEFIITINLYHDGDISVETLQSVKEEFRENLVTLYVEFNLRKRPCSYDLGGFERYVNVFFDANDIIERANRKYKEECDDR